MGNMSVLILGASDRPDRYSFKAAESLERLGYPIFLVANQVKEYDGKFIRKDFPAAEKIDVITLYLGPRNQEIWYDSIISAQPRKVIFNPGTENPALQERLNVAGIAWEEACTLVLLQTGQFP